MNKAEYIARSERFAREQLDRLGEIARDLRACGHVKEAEHAEREASRARRRVERDLEALPVKLDATDARLSESLSDLLAELERRLAG
ncbi:hypothetical protein [Burkholderia ambifaria]|jgi:hypothetical protein|uniref:hypothetical protein n=1 Tax=Burkholderia ambifaria TaxID=152480 RepID=UPI001B9A6AFE|nr:hypothetical protein [Burkholderia ambifaria]MBR8225757.1 hypothetical protein [Burkholderia ambifaria]